MVLPKPDLMPISKKPISVDLSNAFNHLSNEKLTDEDNQKFFGNWSFNPSDLKPETK